MSAQTSALNLNSSRATASATWRSRTLAIILMFAIAGIFWIDSRYPALLKRYHAGTQIKAAGELTYGQHNYVERRRSKHGGEDGLVAHPGSKESSSDRRDAVGANG